MSPFYWLRTPVALLRTLHEFKGTFCCMPNFAFNHCVRNIRDRELEGLDLSHCRSMYSGAEPIRQDTIEAFARRFAAYGLRRTALKSSYGLAENVLTVSFMQGDGPPRADRVGLADLQIHRRAVPVASEEPGGTTVVSTGPPIPSTEVEIRDARGQRLPERSVGEITVRSSHMLTTYYRRPEVAARVLRDGWLHTGDLGYLADGEVYVCGREKDLIIVGGSNIFPEDVESLADAVPGVQPGRAVAFGVSDERLGTERVVIVCELRQPPIDTDARTVELELRRRVVQDLGVTIGEVRFVDRGWIIKTSSGKLARSANRDKYLKEAVRDHG